MKKLSIIEVKQRARAMGLIVDKTAKKAGIIRTIQALEGNTPCFGTREGGKCEQDACCWRADCLS
jgi:hypothetical protein